MTTMQLRFDADQEYQVQAIEAVADLLDGQPMVELDHSFALASSAALMAVANELDLSDDTLLANLHTTQTRNGITPDDALAFIDGTIDTPDGPLPARFPNFTVEMETGTGKTYVYLRTALELYRRYRQRKFIVVVPSVAIREGVLKTLQMTEQHFRELYGNLPYRYHVYDSANLTPLRHFAMSDGVEIMVMTIDSFKRSTTVIQQSTDRLQGSAPIDLVRAARPILILDEPQNMESELSVAALATLHPLFALRYSATHRNPYNLVYRLTPYDAYRQGLVKRIEVAAITAENDANRPFLQLENVGATSKSVTAKVTLHKLMKTGMVKLSTVTVRAGESLGPKASRPEYAEYVVEEIDAAAQTLRFTNQLVLARGEAIGVDRAGIFDHQLRYTIREHMRKQERLRPHGIKVLSLIFIDRVANYVDDGLIRRLFDKAFDDIKGDFPDWNVRDAASVQAAYFAQQRRRGGSVELVDSTNVTNQRDAAAYDLIMREKERLLSFDEPVAFIFSHSALREGWDNPNLFQICTLNQTASIISKRQEIGRGVRLAVDQTGERSWSNQVNILTVIANESYERYVQSLQSELEDDYGKEGLPPRPANARARHVARLRKERLLSPEFQGLWERIRQKTRYTVRIDAEKLVSEVVNDLEQVIVSPPRFVTRKAGVEVADDANRLRTRIIAEGSGDYTRDGRPLLPSVIDIMLHLLEFTTPPAMLTRRTLLEIFMRLPAAQQQAALGNPQEFASIAVRTIKNHLPDHLVDGVRYERINDWYEMTQFDAEVESWMDKMVPTERSLYDYTTFDSEVERRFAESLELYDPVRCYVKLPKWFLVPTPVGDYNPDWAIVVEDRDPHGDSRGLLLYLVRETKGTENINELRFDEKRKVLCGMEHFRNTLGVDYDVITSVDDLIVR